LRAPGDDVTSRIADELVELVGALDGTHRHVDLDSDVALEGGQVCYWVALRCIREGLDWETVRPDRALDAPAEVPTASTLATLLRAEAEIWSLDSGDVAARAHQTFALVAAACATAGIAPLAVILHDLDDLRSRPYLADYFATVSPG
jgi:hypothetical protein